MVKFYFLKYQDIDIANYILEDREDEIENEIMEI